MNLSPQTETAAAYRSRLYATYDGAATFAICERRNQDGRWMSIGQTNRFRAYPQSVRARDAADALIRRYADAPYVHIKI
jgi:hypothetical protein